MHIAIDDTYSSNVSIDSQYVTSERRTNVAVFFPDSQVEQIRHEITGCLDELSLVLGARPDEFHFVDIVNRKGAWSKLDDGQVIGLLSTFVHIYNAHRWKVLVQTVDKRTFADHGMVLGTTLHGLNPEKKEDQSLFLLMLRLRSALKGKSFCLVMDEGRGRPGDSFGADFFPEWGESFKGYFESSKQEPLLQIADFVAYSVNRLTNLSTKSKRSAMENAQVHVLGRLALNSYDVRRAIVRPGFGKKEFDEIHHLDRKQKGLEPG